MGNPRKIRGEFRPIYEALFHGKDYRRLSPDAKLCLLTLKGLCGAIGLKAWPALAESLADLTTILPTKAKRAVAELIALEWIEYEDGIVWLVRGLEFEPQVSHGIKHRTWLQNAIVGLPSAPILARFRMRYAVFFEDLSPTPADTPPDSLGDRVSDTLSHTLGDTTTPTPTPSPSPTNKNNNSTSSAVAVERPVLALHGEPLPRKPPRSELKYPHFPMPLCVDMHAMWCAGRGSIKLPVFRTLFGDLFTTAEAERPESAPTNLELKDALRVVLDLASEGNGAPYLTAANCAQRLAGVAKVRRQYANDPETRLAAVERILHGRAA